MISVDRMPAKGETIHGFNYVEAIGGKGSNQAATSSKLGANTYLLGTVGDDSHGKKSIEVLKSFGLNIDNVTISKELPTGTAFVITSEGDNRIILNEGANSFVNSGSLDLIKEKKEGDIFVAQLENPVVDVEQTILQAKKANLTIVFNPAPAKEISKNIFKKIDFMILNQSETEYYTEIYPHTVDDCIKAGEILLARGVLNVIITLGAKGCVAVNSLIHHYIPGHTISVKDTTGAGDTFIGAFVYALSKEINLLESLQLANAAGALACSKYGAKESIPSYEEIKNKILIKG